MLRSEAGKMSLQVKMVLAGEVRTCFEEFSQRYFMSRIRWFVVSLSRHKMST